MKRVALIQILILSILSSYGLAQDKPDNSKIDILLIKGDYNKVIDTCKQILNADTLNSEIWYKMGLAYQSLLSDDKSFDCFLKAAGISPENKGYMFSVAKGYFNKGKSKQAKPLLLQLCEIDSTNWAYAYYLTSIYMQENLYDESIEVYNRFYKQDPENYSLIDKIGFASLRKGEYDNALEMYNRSLAFNKNNVSAMKNLAFLYTSKNMVDTALYMLTRGMKTDPTDMDLYVRRASLHFTINYNKRALNDYLKVLSSGDSATLYLKRAGIGYTNNLQPKEANRYLLLAYKKDSSDFETSDYLARNYEKLKDAKNSIYYYKRSLAILSPFTFQQGRTYVMLAEVFKSTGNYKEAIDMYQNGQRILGDVNIYMIIANIYDEQIKDIPKAIHYYQLFLDNVKNAKNPFSTEYVQSIKSRLEYLKNPPQI